MEFLCRDTKRQLLQPSVLAFSRFDGLSDPGSRRGASYCYLRFWSFNPRPRSFLPIAFDIFLLTYTNTRGIKEGEIHSNNLYYIKLLSLFGLIILGFVLVKDSFWAENWKTGLHAMKNITGKSAANQGGMARNRHWENIGGASLWFGQIAASMVGSIFSSDAWNNVTFIVGRSRTQKGISGSVFFGTLIVTIIYISREFNVPECASLSAIALSERWPRSRRRIRCDIRKHWLESDRRSRSWFRHLDVTMGWSWQVRECIIQWLMDGLFFRKAGRFE